MGDIGRRGAVALTVTGLPTPLTLALGTAPAQAASCTTTTGPYQKQVEKFLGRPVDGKQRRATTSTCTPQAGHLTGIHEPGSSTAVSRQR